MSYPPTAATALKKPKFRTLYATGKHRNYFPPYHEIRYNKRPIGNISPLPPYKIKLLVTLGSGCRDVILKRDSPTVRDAQDWLTQNFEKLHAMYNLFGVE